MRRRVPAPRPVTVRTSAAGLRLGDRDRGGHDGLLDLLGSGGIDGCDGDERQPEVGDLVQEAV